MDGELWEDAAVAPYIDVIDPWPHQSYAVNEVLRLHTTGQRLLLVASPTGGGKTYVMGRLARAFLLEGHGVTILCNRKMLLDQMSRSMTTYDLAHGVRAAGNSATLSKLQVTSVQTEHSRVIKRKVWDGHDNGLVIVDEAHMNTGRSAQEVIRYYYDRGATVVGFTATPVDMGDIYEQLVVAGVTSQLQKCGALVPARHFGCTEPDLKAIRRYKVGEDLSEPDNVKAIMVPGIHGRVIDHYRRLNPHGLPAVGFAPGVPESLGFAQAFEAAGIPAAHIDGGKIVVRGEQWPTTRESRDKLLEYSRTGKVRIVWNRFVLREAIDMPWLRHGILATVFGSLKSFLQSGGRLVRACAPVGKRDVCVQDHGGNWWRHGSLNADRHWRLGDACTTLAQIRADAVTGDANDGVPTEPEPFRCPRCDAVMGLMRHLRKRERVECLNCGHAFDFSRRTRPVLQSNGQLVEHAGPAFSARRVQTRSDTLALWKKAYWRAKNSGMTFSAAVGLFFHEHGYWPPRTLPLMPVEPIDWYKHVKSVPFTALRPDPDHKKSTHGGDT